jgi:predicted SnoaL-like aldol condensation-catalyzing enzyme
MASNEKKEQKACPRSIQYTEAAARYWSPHYIQHSAHIETGREGLFNLIKASPVSLTCDPGVMVAEGDFVIVHGRFSGTGLPRNWIAADIVLIADGVLAEHWDVLQNEGLALASNGTDVATISGIEYTLRTAIVYGIAHGSFGAILKGVIDEIQRRPHM